MQGSVALGKDVSVFRNLKTPEVEVFVQCLGLIFLAKSWYGPAALAGIFSVCWDFIFRLCLSLWDSFLYLAKLHWFLYLLLSYFYDPGVLFFLKFEFPGKRFVEWEHVGKNIILCLLPCILLLYIDWIRKNYGKLSRIFVGAIRTTKIKWRVSLIDL